MAAAYRRLAVRFRQGVVGERSTSGRAGRAHQGMGEFSAITQSPDGEGGYPLSAVRLTREEIYRLVWSEPMQRVAKRLGISDVMLAKHCKRLEVPRPGRGYWQRVAAGQRLSPPPLLPPKKASTPDACVIAGALYETRTRPAPKEPLPSVVVEPALTAPHALVRSTREAIRQVKPDSTGLVNLRRREDVLDISVSPESVDRALRILDALIKAVEARGGHVQVRYRPQGWQQSWHQAIGTVVELEGEVVAFRLRELLNRRPHTPSPEERQRQKHYPWNIVPAWDYSPSGRLSLEIVSAWHYTGRTRWTDGKRQRLEHCLGQVLAALQQAATEQREHKEAEARRRQWEAEEARRRLLEQQRREHEEARRRQLREEAERWELVRRLRDYVEAVEQEATKRSIDVGEQTPLGQWIAWARSVAADLDPLPRRLNAPAPKEAPPGGGDAAAEIT